VAQTSVCDLSLRSVRHTDRKSVLLA
jgi:hypothetical protein